MDERRIQRTALIIVTLSAFTTPFMGSSVNIALPSIGKDLDMDAVLLTWVPTCYVLAAAASLVPFGRLGDIHGRKKVFGLGTLLFTLFSFLCGIAPSASTLLVFRFLQGLASSMVFATGLAIVTSVFPPQARGRVLGINVATVYAGLSAGPVLGGLLTEHFTWRSIFLVIVPMGLVIATLTFRGLKQEWADAKGERFDWQGSAIYATAIAGVMYGVSLLPAAKGLGTVFFGLLILGAFVLWEIKTPQPVFQLRLFIRNRIFAFSCLAALINYSSTFALAFFMSLYLQHIRGLTPREAGLIMISQPVVMAVFAPLAGRLSDRIEPRIVASVGMSLTTLGLLLFVFLTKDSSMGSIVTNLILLGLGYALFSSPNTNAIMSSVERRLYGIASGTVGTMRMLGMMVSMGVATVLFAVLIGRVQITPQHYPALMKTVVAAFAVYSVLSFAGIFASFVRGDLRDKAERPRPP